MSNKFNEYFDNLLSSISVGDIIQNWSVLKGYTGGSFEISEINKNYIKVHPHDSKNKPINVTTNDFSVMYKNWKSYINLEIKRSILKPDSRNCTYTMSLMRHIELIEFKDEAFDALVLKAMKDNPEVRQKRLDSRISTLPKKVKATVIRFQRNPDVVANTLLRADGYCEQCSSKAPFTKKSNGMPYLEIHHIIQLAHGGNDTEENAIALCPNCHRENHFG